MAEREQGVHTCGALHILHAGAGVDRGHCCLARQILPVHGAARRVPGRGVPAARRNVVSLRRNAQGEPAERIPGQSRSSGAVAPGAERGCGDPGTSRSGVSSEVRSHLWRACAERLCGCAERPSRQIFKGGYRRRDDTLDCDGPGLARHGADFARLVCHAAAVSGRRCLHRKSGRAGADAVGHAGPARVPRRLFLLAPDAVSPLRPGGSRWQRLCRGVAAHHSGRHRDLDLHGCV